MKLVFSSEEYPTAKRFEAWRAGVCDNYVQVDMVDMGPSDYVGYIKEASFGPVTLTETQSPPLHIVRRRSHLSRVSKDCIYVCFAAKSGLAVAATQSEHSLHRRQSGSFHGVRTLRAEEHRARTVHIFGVSPGTVREAFLRPRAASDIAHPNQVRHRSRRSGDVQLDGDGGGKPSGGCAKPAWGRYS